MKILAFVLLIISTFAIAQEETASEVPVPDPNSKPPPPPQNTRVKWGEVEPYSFTVRWDAVPEAFYYEVQLLNGYTINELRLHRRVKNNYFTFDKLLPNKVYGIKVRTVDQYGRMSKPGVPARTRTRFGTTIPVTTTPKPTDMVPVGNCGQGKFTCQSGRVRCIKADLWCDRRSHCEDKSDERGCPGGCPELRDENFPNGNFSCSRWGSPRSYCFFTCYPGFERDGSWYFKCDEDGKWSRDIPVCRLPGVKEVELAIALGDFVEFAFSKVEGAYKYKVYLFKVGGEDNDGKPMTYEVPFSEDEMILYNIQELIPNTQYSLYIVPLSQNDDEGMRSNSLNFETSDGDYGYGYGYDYDTYEGAEDEEGGEE